MFIALRDGQLDESVDHICGPPPQNSPSVAERFSLPPMPAVPSSVMAVADLPAPDRTTAAHPEQPPPSQPLIPRRPAPTLTDLVLADLEGARARAVPPPKPPRGGGRRTGARARGRCRSGGCPSPPGPEWPLRSAETCRDLFIHGGAGLAFRWRLHQREIFGRGNSLVSRRRSGRPRGRVKRPSHWSNHQGFSSLCMTSRLRSSVLP